MRFLIVDQYYGPAQRAIYGADPDLEHLPYADQLDRVHDALFGETAFEVDALRALGHEASDCLLNVYPLAVAWSRQQGIALPRRRLGFRRRRGWLPWFGWLDSDWATAFLLSQVRSLKPDVVHIQAPGLVSPQAAWEIGQVARIVTGQIAADVTRELEPGAYRLMVSSIPGLVDQLRGAGIDAEWLPLAFAPTVAARIGERPRDIGASFVGSISVSHPERVRLLERVAQGSRVDVWTADHRAIPPTSPLRHHLHGEAFGRAMYEVLARTNVAINTHARIARGASNNLRLYEATGMGALLVTEDTPSLRDLFVPGAEVASYRDADHAAQVVRHYLDHPGEAREIADAGTRRTLSEHTWLDRMRRFVTMVERRV